MATTSKTATKKTTGKSGEEASRLIDAKLQKLGDWRAKVLERMRKLILAADAGVVEEMKWGDVPVWSHHGILCTGESYKQHVKLTFAKGASLPDPSGLFNASLDGNMRRAIDIHEGDADIDEKAFKALVRAAIELNQLKGSKAQPSASRRSSS